jgi:NAD(P)-dependent dehydrogenase (short-subunit alcohol dehydrogenase family)
MNMKDKVILVTGSTDGLGCEVAKRLAGRGAHVVIHGRDVERGECIVRKIRAEGGSATLYCADVSTLSGVHALAGGILDTYERLDVLVNNAGIGTGVAGSARQVTADGIELRFAVNYLAGFALTRRLLPLLLKSTNARIVNVASIGQHSIDFDNVMLSRGYSGAAAYCQSKLAQIMFTIDFAEEVQHTGVTVNCLHPATYMDTTMVRNDGIAPVSKVEQGADAVLHLVTAPEKDRFTGRYFNGTQLAKAHPDAYIPSIRERLRQLSFDISGLPLPR